jgi:hypothetical protein
MGFTEVEKLGLRGQGKRIGNEIIEFFIHTTQLSGNSTWVGVSGK